jgi:cytochrome P450/NADPH-cytochrome P450 reductase
MPSYEQGRKLVYVRQILDETLRLWPTAPIFTRTPLADVVLVDKYAIRAGAPVSMVLPMLHRDRGVWGEDAEDFNPDHTSPERLVAIPPNAYKPFGTGQRSCIGRQFALQEATLVLGMLLQRFEFIDHRNYQLETLSTLTIKPKDFIIKVKPREGRLEALRAGVPVEAATEATTAPAPATIGHGTPLLIMFGSDLGTAEGIANKLAREAGERGFAATVGPLDDYVGKLPTEGAVLIVCSSYNGLPPENAVQFVKWLSDGDLSADALAGLSYTVFGCGDTDWAATYQRVPTLLDTELAEHGANRLHDRGAGDAHADFDGQYRAWHADLWSTVADRSAWRRSSQGPPPSPRGSPSRRSTASSRTRWCSRTRRRRLVSPPIGSSRRSDPQHLGCAPPDISRWRCPMTWNTGLEIIWVCCRGTALT